MNSPEQTLQPPTTATAAEPLREMAWFGLGGRARRATYGMLAWFLLVTVAFAQPLIALAFDVLHSDLDSYIVMVPLAIAYLLYLRRDSLATTCSAPVMAAIVTSAAVIVAAAAFGFQTQFSPHDFLALLTFAYVTLILAGGFLFLGTRWMTSAAFPMAFLLFLVPLPDGVVEALEKASVLASSEVANAFFSASGIPFLRDGSIFQLPTITLRVAQECSGIRSSWVLVISSFLAGNLFLTKTWSRAALVAFVIPLGIVRNGFRILTLGMLCVHIGPHMIDSAIHHYGGPLFFALSLGPFALFLRWLSQRERRS